MQFTWLYVLYLVPVLGILGAYWRRHRRLEQASLAALQAATEAGMLEPPTLHPEIDLGICVGCKSCVVACPEQDAHPVLGMIGKKARLVGPSDCIGHGVCKEVCPVGAIKLVFGTATRGIDIPLVNKNFETNVPGVFIAGELGGMGLVRNAIEQGRQAMASIGELLQAGHSNEHDVLIVGAGPAGFSASLAALESGLRAVTVEQEELGGTVAHFPRQKLVMLQPAELPLYGKMEFGEIIKEDLIAFWQGVARDTGVTVNYAERVDAIAPAPGGSGFFVTTNRATYDTRCVLLAIGRRGSPRQLGVPGEELPKVAYRLIDPEQYCDQHVLIVGGGDSALEAATSIAEQPGTTVTLSYRSGAFSRAKPKNRDKIEAMRAQGRLKVLFNSNVKAIMPDKVVIALEDRTGQLRNDAVIISAGGILPSAFLRTIGIHVETKWGSE